MTDNFEMAEAVAAAYARRMIRAGYEPEDIAAAFAIEGIALARIMDGDAATIAVLRAMEEHIHAS